MSRSSGFCFAVALAAATSFAAGQEPAPGPYTCTMDASARTQEAGCYIIAKEKVDHLPAGPLFWHLYTYATLQRAKRGQQESGGTVAESSGKVWLFRIAAENWRPEGGDRVAVIGPLEVSPGKVYEARYLEAVLPPGRPGTPVHRHPGRRLGTCSAARNACRRPTRPKSFAPAERLSSRGEYLCQ